MAYERTYMHRTSYRSNCIVIDDHGMIICTDLYRPCLSHSSCLLAMHDDHEQYIPYLGLRADRGSECLHCSRIVVMYLFLVRLCIGYVSAYRLHSTKSSAFEVMWGASVIFVPLTLFSVCGCYAHRCSA